MLFDAGIERNESHIRLARLTDHCIGVQTLIPNLNTTTLCKGAAGTACCAALLARSDG